MQEGIITLLDILGWKGAWQKHNSESPLEGLQSLLKIAEQICEVCTDVDISNKILPSKGKYEVISISDTIAIVSQPAKTVKQIGGQLRTHEFISALLIKFSIIHSIPIRGAISAGKFSKAGNTFIGPAVDEVAAWHELGEWIGVMAAPSIGLRADEILIGDNSRVLIPYKVPVKGGIYDTFCVDWIYEWERTQEGYEAFAEVFKLLRTSAQDKKTLVHNMLKMGPLTPDIYPKYKNTLTYYDSAVKWRKENFPSGDDLGK